MRLNKDLCFLINGTFLGVSGDGSGKITINGRNIDLADNTVFNGGINPEKSVREATPGNIAIAARGNITNENRMIYEFALFQRLFSRQV